MNMNKLEKIITAVFGAIILAVVCLVCFGCATITVTNTTKDGRVFEARAVSCLWDRQLKGLKFDYEAGTLEVETYNSSTDKETVGKALDTATTALGLATKLAL